MRGRTWERILLLLVFIVLQYIGSLQVTIVGVLPRVAACC